MAKYVLLFLIVGLAIGLALGFNPVTHRQIVRWWTHTERQSSVTVPTVFGRTTPWNSRLSRLLRSSPRPQLAPPSDRAIVPSSSQISAELQMFWNALHRLWLSLVAKAQAVIS